MSHDRRSIAIEKRKSKRKRRIFLFIFLPIILLTLSATAYGTFLYNKAQSVMEDSYNPIDRTTKRASAAQPDIDSISVLFIGVDDSSKRSFSTSSRSDALMLATFNKDTKSVKLLSIPRDSYVYIPKLGYQDKITHAHANGGPATTIETVEELLDIPVDFYVKVNFNAFIDIVEALDGIKVDVPYAFSEQDSNDTPNAISLEPGYQLLNGEEALALARTRKQDSDIQRGVRQQEILKAIVNRAVSVGSISKYATVIDAVGKNMETDLTFDQMKAFLNYATEGTSINIESLNLAGQDMYLPNSNGNRVYYYELDEINLAEIQTELKNHLDLGNTEYGQNPAEKVDNTVQSEYQSQEESDY
ncbi:LCP family protein [Cytobacillus firmus]|uniref:LCP family protein n=1 Tax=Cytobacillus firmus TaxID=1399 RepID=UPI0021875D4A|nr:LCP family protein [Cytobacillus firmus]URM33434.1 LCP family protein [Cytobacillus firmus]